MLYPVFIAVAHHRQEHSFPDLSLATFKFPDISMLSLVYEILLLLNLRLKN